jgi:PD-(D/E)XK endonuclease
MHYWERFTSMKQRGEWVELQFMAEAAKRCFAVSKPWGDTRAYDVGIEYKQNLIRVQVKSTIVRSGAGYRCQFTPNYLSKHDYSLDQIDLFAAYVIPEEVWYLIPAVLLLGEHRKMMAMLSPVRPPAKKASYCYESYRENWKMLTRSRDELLQCTPDPFPFRKSHHSKSRHPNP